MYLKKILYHTPVDTYGLLDNSGSLTEDLDLPHFLICETRFSVSRVSRSLNIQLVPSRGFSWAAPQTWCWSWHFTVTAPVWQEEEEQGAMLASCTPGDRPPILCLPFYNRATDRKLGWGPFFAFCHLQNIQSVPESITTPAQKKEDFEKEWTFLDGLFDICNTTKRCTQDNFQVKEQVGYSRTYKAAAKRANNSFV